jgi:hypothetical protein
VSNNIINPGLGLTSGQLTGDTVTSNEGDSLSLIPCAKCGVKNISKSVPQRLDGLIARLTIADASFSKGAEGPYRCLSCHHRFWLGQTIGFNNKRTWALIAIVLVCILMLLKVVGIDGGSSSEHRIGVVVPEFDQAIDQQMETRLSRDNQTSDSIPSLASLINMPQGVDNARSREGASEVFASYEKPLTPEQKARQLAQAKQEAEQAERLSQARIEQLDRALSPADDELESLVKIEVGYVLEQWREAWEKGDLEAYLTSYSANFTPSNKLTVDAWKANRRARVTPEKKISVELTNFDITMLDQLSSGVIEFQQRYESGSYRETSRKQIKLAREQGAWKITSEVELN